MRPNRSYGYFCVCGFNIIWGLPTNQATHAYMHIRTCLFYPHTVKRLRELCPTAPAVPQTETGALRIRFNWLPWLPPLSECVYCPTNEIYMLPPTPPSHSLHLGVRSPILKPHAEFSKHLLAEPVKKNNRTAKPTTFLIQIPAIDDSSSTRSLSPPQEIVCTK